MNTNGAAADFQSIQYYVIGLGPDFAGICRKQVEIFIPGGSAGMVSGRTPGLFLVPFQEREILDPEEIVSAWLNEIVFPGQVQPEGGEGFMNNLGLPGNHQQSLTGLQACRLAGARQLIFRDNFRQGAYQAVCTILADKNNQVIKVFPGVGLTFRGGNAFNKPAILEDVLEYLEGSGFKTAARW